MERSFFSFVFLLICLLMLSTEDGSAQLSSATLNGVVRDSTGAVINNASLVLRNLGTSVERVTASNDTGNYMFSDVTPGPYTLNVSAPSFATKQVSEFVLAVSQTATIDITLSAGSESEVMTVTATGEQLQRKP